MNCQHTDRERRLSPYDWKPVCEECFAAQVAERKLLTPYQGKREAWDHASYDYQRIGNDTYTRTTRGLACEYPSDERTWK